VIKITEEVILPERVLQTFADHRAGAVVTFEGRVRQFSSSRPVTHLYYEAYPEMAHQELAAIRDEALRRWPLVGAAIVHRTGRLEVGELSVFIAVASEHRAEAFEACRFVIDTLKETVPIWKKEYFEDGEVWV
jgi:molybdopterin synthase catalytic subunit